MTPAARFLEPLDVLTLRGNKLFGDPGSFGESLVPPWPSLAAGALRARMLVDAGIDPTAFARGECAHPELGTPAEPGSFAVTAFHLARRHPDGRVEALIATPADLVVHEAEDNKLSISRLTPTLPAPGLHSSAPLPRWPLLAEAERRKPESGYWLGQAGWQRYLAGQTPQPADLVASEALWRIDARVGVGLDAGSGRAADGKLFSTQTVAMRAGVGFLATIAGATAPADGTLRLGGDGRAARVSTVALALAEPDYEAIIAARRCRMVLVTPGLFTQGWLMNGSTRAADGSIRFDLRGVRGTLVGAAVARAEVVSGWNLAEWQPKPAERVAPTGSVYWLDDLDASPAALRKLVETGLWGEPCEDAARRAEGYNRFTFAAY